MPNQIKMGRIYKKIKDTVIRTPDYFIPLKVDFGVDNSNQIVAIYEGNNPSDDVHTWRVAKYTLESKFVLLEEEW